MSEYQYYEFQAIDRPLTRDEMQELRSYSTRARITRTSFVNDYSWGRFKGDPDGWMEKYFDAFIYFANWGTHVLKLRLPSRLLDLRTAREYCVGDSAYAWEKGGKVIVSFNSEDEEGENWTESEGRLSWLMPVRAELARGDLRALYLGWLLCVQNHELDDEEVEPPVPAGLGQLGDSLDDLADFLRIDGDLLDVAAEASGVMGDERLSYDEVRAWVVGLPAGEKDDVLARFVVEGDMTAATELLQRFLTHRGSAETSAGRRTVGELLKAAEMRAQERLQAEAGRRAEDAERRKRQAEIARAEYLDKIASRQPKLWTQIEGLIATKQPKRYDEAVKLLIDLRDLAQREGKDDKFRTRMEAIHAVHARKPSFLERLRKAGL